MTASPGSRGTDAGVLEQALLPVTPGREAEFEAAFDKALMILAGMPASAS